MKCLNIQLQSELCSGDVAAHVDSLTQLVSIHSPDAVVNVERGDDDGPYTNVNIDAEDIPSLWSVIADALHAEPSLASATIVCCEGENGWDDYLLLHHFDETETIDTLN